MSFWRLKIERPLLDPEVIDLRLNHQVSAGESPKNTIALDTTLIPARHPLVREKSGRAYVRLTHEIAETLKGSAHFRKAWKSRLHSGKEFEAEGDLTWTIGNNQFELSRIPELKLTPMPRVIDPMERKAWWRSSLTTAGVHILALIVFFLVSVLPIFKKPEEPQVQKVSLMDVQKILQNKPVPPPAPKPEEVTPVQPAETQREVKKAQEVRDNLPAPSTSENAQVAARTPVKAAHSAGRTAGNQPRKVENLGLLAIQTNMGKASPNAISMRVAAPRAPSNSNARELGTSLGSGNAEFGLGSGKDQTQMAKLEGIEGPVYRGGLSRNVTAKTGPNIHLARKEIEVVGGLDRGVIQQIIDERTSEIRYCYETALLKNQGLTGKIAISWTIMADGSVSNLSSASDEISASILQPCLRQQIQNWKFPEVKGGGIVRVKYPFVFNPIGG